MFGARLDNARVPSSAISRSRPMNSGRNAYMQTKEFIAWR